MEFLPKTNDFGGLVGFLNSVHLGGKPNSVFVEESSHDPGFSNASCLIDKSNNGTGRFNNWASFNQPNQYFIVHFKYHFVMLSHYSFQARTDTYGNVGDFPRKWVVEGSRNQKDWNEVDFNESNILQNYSQSETFKCEKKQWFRSFRFRQTGLNSTPNNYFVLHQVELFGMISDHLFVCTSKHSHSRNLWSLSLAMLVFYQHR